MTTREREEKKEHARLLYMQGDDQKTIASRLNVSEVTISRWAASGGWRELRAAKNVTRPQLINKLLLSIDKLITKVQQSDEVSDHVSLIKSLKSFADTIDKLDKRANVVDVIEVCTAFGRWMELRMSIDPEVTPEFVRKVVGYQDLYIQSILGSQAQ